MMSIELSNILRCSLLFLMTVILNGCATGQHGNVFQKTLVDGPVSVPSDRGAVVFGVSVHSFAREPIMGISFANIEGDGGSLARGKLTAVVMKNCFGFWQSPACQNGMTYYMILVPAGKWALSGFNPDANELRGYPFIRQQQARLFINGSFQSSSASGPVAINPATPSFSIGAGEVLYIGDFAADLEPQRFHWSQKIDENAAREFLKNSGLGGRLILRPWAAIDDSSKPSGTLPADIFHSSQ